MSLNGTMAYDTVNLNKGESRKLEQAPRFSRGLNAFSLMTMGYLRLALWDLLSPLRDFGSVSFCCQPVPSSRRLPCRETDCVRRSCRGLTTCRPALFRISCPRGCSDARAFDQSPCITVLTSPSTSMTSVSSSVLRGPKISATVHDDLRIIVDGVVDCVRTILRRECERAGRGVDVRNRTYHPAVGAESAIFFFQYNLGAYYRSTRGIDGTPSGISRPGKTESGYSMEPPIAMRSQKRL